MSGNLPVGQPSGFLNSFLSFLGEGGSEEALASIKTPVLPKYIPEVKRVQRELPEKVVALEDSLESFRDRISEQKVSEDEFFNDQSVSKDNIRNGRRVSEDNVSNGEKDLVMVCVPDSSCDVPELPPVHVSTFQGSFLNRINVNDSQTDDNSKDCPSSGKEDRTTGKTPPVVVKESGSRKRPQSGRRMRTRHYQNKESDEEKSEDSSSSSVDVQPKAASPPIRRQSTRRAKQKIEQKRVANIKKGKRLLSLYTEVSDSNDSETEVDEPSSKASENEDVDSDKDPAWTPAEQLSVTAKRSFGSDNDDELYGKRKRGRPPTTPQKTPTVISEPSPMPQTVIPKPSLTAQTVLPKPSPNIPVIQKVTTVPSTPMTPLAKKGLEDLLPLYEGPPEPDSPHSFQKGDYVIERKDLTNCDVFPIWKIDSGRLLQKFEPIEKMDANFISRCQCTQAG